MTWIHWALLSALFAGLTANLAKVGVKDVDAYLATAIRTLVILVFAWAIAFMQSTQNIFQVSGRAYFFLIISGLATAASWLCYFRALQLGNVSQVAPIDKLSVVFAIALATVFLHEAISFRQCIGAACIVIGSLILAR